MGVRELRDGFNAVSQPDATANAARMSYVQQGGTEWQVLQFTGSWADGSPFTLKSDRLRPGTDVVLAARMAAIQMLQQKGIAR